MAHAGTAHKYSSKLVAFEHASSSSSSSPTAPWSPDALNTLLFVGGLGDGLLTVGYVASLAASLPRSWVLAEVLLSSSYQGWATGSVARDAQELGDCIDYFHKLRPGGKMVLMGHSTGCQDIMEFLVGAHASSSSQRAAIAGAIMQAGVSDREAVDDKMKTLQDKQALATLVEQAKHLIDTGRPNDMVPSSSSSSSLLPFGIPVSAYRTYSLLVPYEHDDFFSSDLSDTHLAHTFGRIPKHIALCFLLGECDPYVPSSVDKSKLVQRWTRVIRHAGGTVDEVNGGILPAGTHNLDDCSEQVVADLVGRVCRFLATLESS